MNEPAAAPAPRVYECRDGAVYDAPIERVFDVLLDLDTYAAWWTLVRVEPRAAHRLAPGVEFRFEGGRPGGAPSGWSVVVREIDAPRRIEFEYTDGDLLGRTAWELEAIGARTRVAYVYRGVTPNAPNSAATLAKFGTRLHSVAMGVDALAGLARYLRGVPLDDAWRAKVREQMAAGVAALTPEA
jgi:uncharacterized protein YndB with AHSA1/START domain